MNDPSNVIYKIQEGIIKNPRKYEAYDQQIIDCKICKSAKLYQSNRLGEGLACAGWIVPGIGPVSCVSYAMHVEKTGEQNANVE